jgi:hypothetical protein
MAETTGGGAQQLYITLSGDGRLKIGTCGHCVIEEPGRPERAWNAEGDKDLDFDRDKLLAELALRGITVDIVEQYVCP